MSDNYRQAGKTFKSTSTDGLDVQHVNVDNITVDLTGATLDPTNLALEAGRIRGVSITPGTAQHISYTGTPGLSSAVGVTIVELCATTDCHILFGAAPTATANSTFLPAKTIVHYTCGTGDKISVIQETSGGTLYITPGT